MAVLLVAVALAGWGLAFTSWRSTDDLEDKLLSAQVDLSKAKAELIKVSDELTAVRETYRAFQEGAVDLAGITEQLETSRAELASLTADIDGAKAELETLRAEAKRHRDFLSGAARTYRTTTRARVRAGSGTGTKEVAVVSAGVPLSVFEMVENETWYRVGITGYMYHELLKPGP
ncbi:MAG: SH3 domain-containing protein [Kiloniellaceae bacterium]